MSAKLLAIGDGRGRGGARRGAEGEAGMRRAGIPALSEVGRAALGAYADHLRQQRDLRPATHRNYTCDLRQFAAWCEGGC